MVEDFLSDWTVNDLNNLLAQTSVRSTTLLGFNRGTSNTYLYRDYGLDFFADFYVEFEYYGDLIALTTSAYNRICPIAFCENELGDYVDTRNDNEMAIIMLDGLSACHLKAATRDGSGGGKTGDPITISIDTLYYCKFFKSGTTVTLQVFSDSARTTQVGSDSTVTCGIGDSYRYIMVNQSLDLTGNYAVENYVQNLDIVGADSKNLFSKFSIRNTDVKDLFSTFNVKHSDIKDLFSTFNVKHSDIKDLFSTFNVILSIYNKNLFSKFSIRNTDVKDLFSTFNVILSIYNKNLFSKFSIRNTDVKDLFSTFKVMIPDYVDVYAEFSVTHSKDLFAFFEICCSEDLFTKFELQRTLEFKALALISGIGYVVKGDTAF